MRGSLPAFPQYIFIAWWCSVKAQGQLYLYVYLNTVSIHKLVTNLKHNLSYSKDVACIVYIYVAVISFGLWIKSL
jgi:hypothetical protein